jgi:hypothetical protein
MPPDPAAFSVKDILELVGPRKIEVVRVKEQTGKTKELSEFVDYYRYYIILYYVYVYSFWNIYIYDI